MTRDAHHAQGNKRMPTLAKFAPPIILCGCLMFASGLAGAQAYPAKPIRLVVAAGAAAPVDIISRWIVELMGGRIGLESAQAKGATFWFEIPFELGEGAEMDRVVAAPPFPICHGILSRFCACTTRRSS